MFLRKPEEGGLWRCGACAKWNLKTGLIENTYFGLLKYQHRNLSVYENLTFGYKQYTEKSTEIQSAEGTSDRRLFNVEDV